MSGVEVKSGSMRCGQLFWLSLVIAWLAGLIATFGAMLGLIAEWDEGLATLQLVWLALAPVVLMLPRISSSGPEAFRSTSVDWLVAGVCGAISLTVSVWIGMQIGDLPPAYHDEFSYLFQAKTLLAGRFSFPSPAVRPELFDQMHVLNEGRMASRYYPGTGLWLAPFVAIGHPYWGPWLAGAIASIMTYWTGRELGGRIAGVVAGLLMALSPGVGLFGNTLLAHHPTLLGLSVFLLGITRMQRTDSGADALVAGAGLSFAMLCRPMTAAGFGLPFGIDVVLRLIRGPLTTYDKSDSSLREEQGLFRSSRRAILFCLGAPLVCGWGVMLLYNRDITGEWFQSPYQVYTEIYTPRHVYGFDNVIRGELRLGPKVIDHYDRWAVNLSPELAMSNVMIRWIASWIWTVDVLSLLMASVILLGSVRWLERRWLLIGLAVLSLHVVHIPYWYVGIMGWHYVFETAPLWCLLIGAATQRLFSWCDSSGNPALKLWWSGLLTICVLGAYLAPPGLWQPRIERGIGALVHPRKQQDDFRRWITGVVTERPALVLLDQREAEESHLDFVSNEPGMASELVFGNARTIRGDVNQIARDFPDRAIYLVNPTRKTVRRIAAQE